MPRPEHRYRPSMTRRAPSGIVVGFDLDMTLVDSRPGIHATLEALAEEYETFIDADVVVERLGPKLEDELARWLPADRVDAAADRYRELYAHLGVPGTALLPGAAAAVAAVTGSVGESIVITAKFAPNAVACLEHVGLAVDRIHGWRHGPEKAVTLLEESAVIYVGDTPADIVAARAADALAVGVTTGPHPADELLGAGADAVLASLEEFPALLRSWAASR